MLCARTRCAGYRVEAARYARWITRFQRLTRIFGPKCKLERGVALFLSLSRVSRLREEWVISFFELYDRPKLRFRDRKRERKREISSPIRYPKRISLEHYTRCYYTLGMIAHSRFVYRIRRLGSGAFAKGCLPHESVKTEERSLNPSVVSIALLRRSGSATSSTGFFGRLLSSLSSGRP